MSLVMKHLAPHQSPTVRYLRWAAAALAFFSGTFLVLYHNILSSSSVKNRLLDEDKTRRLPTLCSHRVVGDEVDQLGPHTLLAMTILAHRGIRCFDADVIRCVRSDRRFLHGMVLIILCCSMLCLSGGF